MCFYFANLIKVRDPTISERITATELVPLLMRFLLKYKQLRETMAAGDKDIWKNLPPALLKMDKHIKYKHNPLVQFLDNPSDYHIIKHVPGALTPVNRVQTSYQLYMKYVHHVDKAKLPFNQYHFKMRGYYIKEDVYWCNKCDMQSNKVRCGDHFVSSKAHTPPKKLDVYTDMQFRLPHREVAVMST